jgi:hypothetical protein
MSRSQRYQDSCDRTLTNLFRNLASDEAYVEISRQNLALNTEFDAQKAFNLIDSRSVGKIDAYDLVDFMRKNYISCDLSDAADIIREYDASNDANLQIAEFSQLVLPATNNGLRRAAEDRPRSLYYRANDPLPYSVVSLLVRLLEKELTLQRHRNDSKRQLAMSPDFVKVRSFDDISRGRSQIGVSDLSYFLERNGFYPRREDIEAILRRLDHNAD